jgi:hypothetical protein
VPLKRFFRWFDESLSDNGEENSEDRSIECSLVRSLSDLRNKEMSQNKLTSNFNEKLFLELSKVEQDPLTYNLKIENFLQKPNIRFALVFASVLVIGLVFFSNFSFQKNIITKIDKFDLSLETAMVEDDELDELDVITDLKKGQEDIDLLRKLEEYYTVHGNMEKADRVHFKLETISK